MLEVYLDPCTVNCRKILAGLDLMGVDAKEHFVDYFKGEQKSDWFTKISPHQTLPCATDGDVTITQSGAILQYAADLNGKNEFYPTDLKQRALVNKWLLWEASDWFPTNYVYLVENVVKPLLGAQPDQSVIDAEAEKYNKNAKILDDQLAKTKWLTGDHVTIADIAVAAPMHLHGPAKVPIEKYPNLKRWLTTQIEELPSWKKTQGIVNEKLTPGKSSTATNGEATHSSKASSSSVRAPFNYTKHVNESTEIYFYDHPEAEKCHAPGDDAHEMEVHDGRYRGSEFSTDVEGFSLHNFKTEYADASWEDDSKVRTEFYPEIVEFLKREKGAKEVLVFDHTIRTAANQAKKISDESNTSQRAPVMLVHCDYTAESGPLRVRQLLGEEKGGQKLKRRVAFFNVWKPIRNDVEERPLAMCDVTSSAPADFMKLFLRYRDRTGENYVMRWNQKHKWWYFPKMGTGEVIVLKVFDGGEEGVNGDAGKGGRARFVGHSAFDDPETPEGARIRESVEIRTICFF